MFNFNKTYLKKSGEMILQALQNRGHGIESMKKFIYWVPC
jgi:hypothetical protein